MSSISAGRFNFGFFLFSLAVLSSLSADTNSTASNTTADGEIPDWSKETKPTTEELPIDKLNFISSTSQKDNSIDGDFILSTRAHYSAVATTVRGENETGNLFSTEAVGDSETAHNASIQSKSITTPETNHAYYHSSLETTATPIDDQTTIASTGADASFSEKVNTTSEPVQNNSFQLQETNKPHLTGNSVDDVTDSWSGNRTTSANTKPTKVTITGVGVKKVISVSFRLKDTKIIGSNSSDVENDNRNASYDSSNDDFDTANSTFSNASLSDSVENGTLIEHINETTSNTLDPQSNSDPSALKPTEADLRNDTEVKLNVSDARAEETVFTSEQPTSTVAYINDSTEIHSDQTRNSTEIPSYSTESQLNATETNPVKNVTEPTEETLNITGVSTKHSTADVSFSGNTTTDTVTEISVSRATVEANNTSSFTTRLETQSTPISTSWPPTSTELGNTTNVDIITTTPQPLIRYAGEMKILRGLSWTKELDERQSPLYKKAAKRIHSLLEDVFAGIGLLKEVEIDGFSEGSVVVDFDVTFVESDGWTGDHLVHAFNSYFKNNTFGDFTIDPQSTRFHVVKIKAVRPTVEPQLRPLLPQWVVAVVVIAAASLVFIILFAAVTHVGDRYIWCNQLQAAHQHGIPIVLDMSFWDDALNGIQNIYGKHYGRRSYNKKLQGDEIIFDKPDYQSGPRLSDAAYENLAADAVYDVESSPEKSDVMIGSPDYQYDSWRSNRLARIPSTKRFSFNSS